MQKRDSLLRAIVCITNFTFWLVTQPLPDNLLGRGGGGGVGGCVTISGNNEVEEKGKGKNTEKQKQNKSLLVFFSESLVSTHFSSPRAQLCTLKPHLHGLF